MKKLFIPLMLAALIPACASNRTYDATMQNYNDVSITGKLTNNTGTFKTAVSYADIFFNGKQQIHIPLDIGLRGEALGDDFNGKKTSATCSSKLITPQLASVDCMIFIDQKRTVTLTF